MSENPNDTIQSLVDSWCDRREYAALTYVLPAWTGNNGLTDGWELLRDSLKHAYVVCTHLPAADRDTLTKTYIDIDYALRNR
jgi:hypothetical protein